MSENVVHLLDTKRLKIMRVLVILSNLLFVSQATITNLIKEKGQPDDRIVNRPTLIIYNQFFRHVYMIARLAVVV